MPIRLNITTNQVEPLYREVEKIDISKSHIQFKFREYFDNLEQNMWLEEEIDNPEMLNNNRKEWHLKGFFLHSSKKISKNDAADIAKTLQDFGFEVTFHKNLNLRQMKDNIAQFSKKIEAEKKKGFHVTALFYYSGHGLQHQNENYLIPISSDIQSAGDIKYENYPNGRVLANLAPAHVKIVMIDACRDNKYRWYKGLPSFRQGLITPELPSTENTNKFKDLPQGTFISFSAAPGQKAQDGEGRNSPYVEAFLETLKEHNKLEIRQLFPEVKLKVHEKTNGQQRSWSSDDLIRDFYFKRN